MNSLNLYPGILPSYTIPALFAEYMNQGSIVAIYLNRKKLRFLLILPKSSLSLVQ